MTLKTVVIWVPPFVFKWGNNLDSNNSTTDFICSCLGTTEESPAKCIRSLDFLPENSKTYVNVVQHQSDK